MEFALFVIICNILIGWYNLTKSNIESKRCEYFRSNLSFGCALVNIMCALAIIARYIYLEVK